MLSCDVFLCSDIKNKALEIFKFELYICGLTPFYG